MKQVIGSASRTDGKPRSRFWSENRKLKALNEGISESWTFRREHCVII